MLLYLHLFLYRRQSGLFQFELNMFIVQFDHFYCQWRSAPNTVFISIGSGSDFRPETYRWRQSPGLLWFRIWKDSKCESCDGDGADSTELFKDSWEYDDAAARFRLGLFPDCARFTFTLTTEKSALNARPKDAAFSTFHCNIRRFYVTPNLKRCHRSIQHVRFYVTFVTKTFRFIIVITE